MTLRALSCTLLLFGQSIPMQAQQLMSETTRQTRVATPYRIGRWPEAHVADTTVSHVRPTLIYRLDTQTIPRTMLPWVRRGVEEWVTMFDSMGVGPKIIVKEQPYTAEPDVAGAAPGCWIGWGNAFPAGPGASDGKAETKLEGDRSSIVIDSSLVASYQRLYFLAVGGQPAGLHFPFPDSVTGTLVEFVIAHEVGHTMTRDHHFRQGAIYPTDSLRNADFLRRHYSFNGSIMAYAALNYVAQPEDHLPLTDLVMHLGMYDRWETFMRYTPEAKRPTGERLRAIQDTAPYLRATVSFHDDPNDQERAVGTDPVKSTGYVLRNMARALPRIDSQSVANPKLPAMLRETLLNNWSVWMGHALAVLGGSRLSGPLTLDPGQTPVVPIDSAQQVEALHFVLTHIFKAQDPILRAVGGATLPDTALVLFETTAPGWEADKWRLAQVTLFNALIGGDRLSRVASQSKTTHVLPVVCAELTTLNAEITQAGATTKDAGVRTHTEQLLQALTPILDPMFGMCSPETPPSQR